MIDFMILALPRSGTTWASNWLTTDTTLCLHDPLYHTHYADLDKIKSNKVLGVSCTGLYHIPNYINAHPARKIILRRDLAEINKSLDEIGLPVLTHADEVKLNNIKGIHIDYSEIFNNPKAIYEYLTQKPFDEERHRMLKEISMQPKFDAVHFDKEVTKRWLGELVTIIEEMKEEK